jgi:hypothetical protein
MVLWLIGSNFKVITILELPNPTNVHTLRSFIGLCNYYRIYVQDFNTIGHPLYALLKKDVAWTWSEGLLGSSQHTQGKAFRVPHFEKI